MRRCDHQEFREIGSGTLPLRLIDVPATIASEGGVSFTPPIDWNFHVISHTWSGEIRNLSQEVGKSIGSYSDNFRGRCFKDDDGYKNLKWFLEVLKGDGVLKVWFDALCINQADESEKQQEILHMGAFYKHSAGCYVVLHGFGKGYDLLDWKMGRQPLPRWFSRVWTLQEFLLPRQLNFVVRWPSTTPAHCMFCSYVGNNIGNNVASEEGEAMEDMVESWMAGHSTKEIEAMKMFFESTEGFLDILEMLAAERIQPGLEDMNVEPDRKACEHMLETLAAERMQPGLQDMNAEHSLLSKVVRNVMEVMFCLKQHTPLIRKTNKHEHYFVGRDAYEIMTWLQYCPPRIPITRHSGVGAEPWQNSLGQLFRLLPKCYICASHKLLDMIQNRFCSNGEDRVLSILALLGLEGRMEPLRSGHTLKQQLVKLAQELATVNPRLLLEMCTKDVTGSPYMGLSWMPNLEEADHMGAASRRTEQWKMRHARVQIKEVTSGGALRLGGRVVGAHLVIGARGSMEQHFNEANCYTCLTHSASDLQASRLLVHQMQDCHLEVPQTLSIPLHATAFVQATREDGRPCITSEGCTIRLDTRWMRLHRNFCPDCNEIFAGGLHFQIPCLHFMPSVDLVLLLWAEVEGGESNVMLCMGTTGLQLHKIGMVRIAQEVSEAIFSNKPTEYMSLGGFGRHDVEQFWTKWGAIQRPIPCNCSLTAIIKAHRSRIGIRATKHKFITMDWCEWKKFRHYRPSDLGLVKGLSIMPSMSCLPPWPPTRIVATTWLRRSFLQQRSDFVTED